MSASIKHYMNTRLYYVPLRSFWRETWRRFNCVSVADSWPEWQISSSVTVSERWRSSFTAVRKWRAAFARRCVFIAQLRTRGERFNGSHHNVVFNHSWFTFLYTLLNILKPLFHSLNHLSGGSAAGTSFQLCECECAPDSWNLFWSQVVVFVGELSLHSAECLKAALSHATASRMQSVLLMRERHKQLLCYTWISLKDLNARAEMKESWDSLLYAIYFSVQNLLNQLLW